MALTDLSVTPLAEVLLACLEEEITQVSEPPTKVSLRPGGPVALWLSTLEDECCTGVAWVRVGQVYPSSSFPDPDSTYARCAPLQWAAVLEMGAARCGSRPAGNEIPTATQLTTLTHLVLDDAAAMRRALCCFTTVERDRMYLPGEWQPLPDEGGCVGGTTTVTVAVDACDCQEA